ncbi:MAG: hypothetical protein A4E35_01511 [Methanoregula sp. PtaU1.Bin051]|nr:MAG: hypothetical protein A4E35_01511 [Methanoregula sp. PtaU1.Bin051]
MTGMVVKMSENLREYLGWCPNAPVLRTAPAVLMTQPATVHPVQPDGGAGGPGRIGRGINLAIESVKTLNRNRQLLYFSLLTGLAIAFMFVAQYCLHLLGTYPYYAIDLPRWLVLSFALQLMTVFCLAILLAGLILGLSAEGNGSPASFRAGLSGTKNYLRRLADWSVIVSLCVTALYAPLHYGGYLRFTLYAALDQFPFNFILFPEVYSTGPIGGTYAMLSAITSTLLVSGITVFLFILTLFVVPLLVLEDRNLHEAVAGSFPLMKKVWSEAAVCFLLFGVILFMVALISLLFRVVYRIVAPEMLLFWYPGDAWIAAAVLFMLALYSLAVILSTVAGIAVMNLYTRAKSGLDSAVSERKEEAIPA